MIFLQIILGLLCLINLFLKMNINAISLKLQFRIERHFARYHLFADYAYSPNIDFIIITFPNQNFRSLILTFNIYRLSKCSTYIIIHCSSGCVHLIYVKGGSII